MANNSKKPVRKTNRSAYMRNAQAQKVKPASPPTTEQQPEEPRAARPTRSTRAKRPQQREPEQFTVRAPEKPPNRRVQKQQEAAKAAEQAAAQAAMAQDVREAAEQQTRGKKNARPAQKKGTKSKRAMGKNKGAESTKKAPPSKKQERTLSKKAQQARLRRIAIIKAVFLLLIAVVGVVMSVILVFRIDTITLLPMDDTQSLDTGLYSESLIVEQLGFTRGDNMFSFRAGETEQALKRTFPLLEEIEIRRSFPNHVEVHIAPAVEAYAIQAGRKWLVLSEKLTVMREEAEQPALMLLSGAQPQMWLVGQTLALTLHAQEAPLDTPQASSDAERADEKTPAPSTTPSAEPEALETIESLRALLALLNEDDIRGGINELIFESENGISFLYENRVAVIIGSTNNLAYKLKFVAYLLKNEDGDAIAATDTGVLDISYQKLDGTFEPVFTQGAAILPRDAVQPTGETS